MRILMSDGSCIHDYCLETGLCLSLTRQLCRLDYYVMLQWIFCPQVSRNTSFLWSVNFEENSSQRWSCSLFCANFSTWLFTYAWILRGNWIFAYCWWTFDYCVAMDFLPNTPTTTSVKKEYIIFVISHFWGTFVTEMKLFVVLCIAPDYSLLCLTTPWKLDFCLLLMDIWLLHYAVMHFLPASVRNAHNRYFHEQSLWRKMCHVLLRQKLRLTTMICRKFIVVSQLWMYYFDGKLRHCHMSQCSLELDTGVLTLSMQTALSNIKVITVEWLAVDYFLVSAVSANTRH